MDVRKLEKHITMLGLPAYRFGQITKAIFIDGVSSFGEITTLSKGLREKLDGEFNILSFEPIKILVSSDNCSIKALLKLEDGDEIETVLISPKPGLWSACISSQVGCPLKCSFCATGTLGLKRNLTAEEITDQVLFWRQYMRQHKLEGNFSNIVYMGMGEPFLNWDNVKESLQVLTDEKMFGFGYRSISVSTAGIPEGIGYLADEFPQINLAISLHFATDEKRNNFMPVNKRSNLDALKVALQQYFQKTNRKVFIEYILLDKVNDSLQDAEQLAHYLRSIGNRHLLHVNLIRYNQATSECVPASKQSTINFKNHLFKLGIHATIRKSLGQDIQGACGQLAGGK